MTLSGRSYIFLTVSLLLFAQISECFCCNSFSKDNYLATHHHSVNQEDSCCKDLDKNSLSGHSNPLKPDPISSNHDCCPFCINTNDSTAPVIESTSYISAKENTTKNDVQLIFIGSIGTEFSLEIIKKYNFIYQNNNIYLSKLISNTSARSPPIHT